MARASGFVQPCEGAKPLLNVENTRLAAEALAMCRLGYGGRPPQFVPTPTVRLVGQPGVSCTKTALFLAFICKYWLIPNFPHFIYIIIYIPSQGGPKRNNSLIFAKIWFRRSVNTLKGINRPSKLKNQCFGSHIPKMCHNLCFGPKIEQNTQNRAKCSKYRAQPLGTYMKCSLKFAKIGTQLVFTYKYKK